MENLIPKDGATADYRLQVLAHLQQQTQTSELMEITALREVHTQH